MPLDRLLALALLALALASATCIAPCSAQPLGLYGEHAGQTQFAVSIQRDTFGNVAGSEYDLSPDGTFSGETIAILQLYTGEGFTFAEPTAALKRKGFEVLRWTSIPALAAFEAGLKQSCQLWIISDDSTLLPAAHISLIQELVNDRKGLFLWADNDPYTATANQVLAALPETAGLRLNGNYFADKVLGEAATSTGAGFSKHLVTTGLERLYEGITVSSVNGMRTEHTPIIRSSDGAVVTAFSDQNGKRILIDGGFTRLYPDRWDRTAGTARFVTNAASWLFNFEGKWEHHKDDDPRKEEEADEEVDEEPEVEASRHKKAVVVVPQKPGKKAKCESDKDKDCEPKEGKYFAASASQWRKCDRSCRVCSGPGSKACTSCKSAARSRRAMLFDGECVDECPHGSHQVDDASSPGRSGYICELCDSACGWRGCYGAGPSACNPCPNPDFEYDGECVEACPSHMPADARRVCRAPKGPVECPFETPLKMRAEFSLDPAVIEFKKAMCMDCYAPQILALRISGFLGRNGDNCAVAKRSRRAMNKRFHPDRMRGCTADVQTESNEKISLMNQRFNELC